MFSIKPLTYFNFNLSVNSSTWELRMHPLMDDRLAKLAS